MLLAAHSADDVMVSLRDSERQSASIHMDALGGRFSTTAASRREEEAVDEWTAHW